MTVNSSPSSEHNIKSSREYLEALFSNGNIGETLGESGSMYIERSVKDGLFTLYDVQDYVLRLLQDPVIRGETLRALKNGYPKEELPKNTPEDIILRVMQKLTISDIWTQKDATVYSLSDAGEAGSDKDGLISNLKPDEMETIFNTHPVRGKVKSLVGKLLGLMK